VLSYPATSQSMRQSKFVIAGRKIHQHINVVQLLRTHLVIVAQKHIHKINRINVIGSRPKRLRHLHHGGSSPASPAACFADAN